MNIREVGRALLYVLVCTERSGTVPEGEDLVAHRSRSDPNFEVLVAHVRFSMYKFAQSLHSHHLHLPRFHSFTSVHSSSIFLSFILYPLILPLSYTPST